MSDEQWARIIKWMQARNLILHVPLRGPIWLEDKTTRRPVRGF